MYLWCRHPNIKYICLPWVLIVDVYRIVILKDGKGQYVCVCVRVCWCLSKLCCCWKWFIDWFRWMYIHDTEGQIHRHIAKASVRLCSLSCLMYVNELWVGSMVIWTRDMVFYVYWTVHHLDSWVKRDQLDVTCFIISLLNAQHVSDVNTSIVRSLRLMCWVVRGLHWSGLMCVGVMLWYGCGGVVSVCRLKQHNSNTHRTRSMQPMK